MGCRRLANAGEPCIGDTPNVMPLPVKALGGLAALLFAATALQVFLGRGLTPLSEPLPFFAYPVFVLTLFGWAWWSRTVPRT